MSLSPKQLAAEMTPAELEKWLGSLDEWVLAEILREEWWWTARPEQRHPDGDWFIWLLLSGRGFGKTRTAAEWLAERVLKYPFDATGFRTEWLIIAETLSDAMHLCVMGPAGIARVFERLLGAPKPHSKAKEGRWRISRAGKPYIQLYAEDCVSEQQIIYIEGADDEDVGRGYNAAGAWLDEFAKWPKPDGSWIEGIAPSLRADLPGDFPRVIVATTPKLVVQLVEWEDRTDGSVHLTTGSTYDNAANLAAPTLAELARRYEGTRLGQQELHGKLIREIQGAMWSLQWVDGHRVDPAKLPELRLTVVGMDPAGTGERDETGLVCAARGSDGHDYVLGDWSGQVSGSAAARRAWEMVRQYDADWLVVEKNMGQRWLSDVLVQEYKAMQKEKLFPPGGNPPIKLLTAKVGKKLRAEPVAARYEQGDRVHHVKGQGLGDLETQMITWVPDDTPESPDRIDALVYALLQLFDKEKQYATVTAPPMGPMLGAGGMGPLAGPPRRPF